MWLSEGKNDGVIECLRMMEKIELKYHVYE